MPRPLRINLHIRDEIHEPVPKPVASEPERAERCRSAECGSGRPAPQVQDIFLQMERHAHTTGICGVRLFDPDSKELAEKVRTLLSERKRGAPFVSYQELATKLGLTPPGTIQRVALALEQTMREDVAAGRPMIAALVVSRTGDMPRLGFFDLAVALGRFSADPTSHREAWQAECAAVLSGVGREGV